MIKITNHATINTYLQVDNEIQPRVKEISKIRNYSMAEICERKTIRKHSVNLSQRLITLKRSHLLYDEQVVVFLLLHLLHSTTCVHSLWSIAFTIISSIENPPVCCVNLIYVYLGLPLQFFTLLVVKSVYFLIDESSFLSQ